MKYQVTQEDGAEEGSKTTGKLPSNGSGTVGIASTSITTTIVGTATTFTYYENSNYLQVAPDIIGINKVFQYNATLGNGMYNVKYQFMLNDVFGLWGGYGNASGYDLTSYSMTMSYLETMNFLLNTHKQIRFNQRLDRIYLDVDWSELKVGEFLIIDWLMDGDEYSRVWNDSFLKKYLTSLIKRQWGQNLIKFQGVKLPGGIEFNGRAIYDDV